MRRASRDTLFLAAAGLMGTMQLFATATVLWATTRPAPAPAPVVVYTAEVRAAEPRPAAMPVRDRVSKVTQAMAPAKPPVQRVAQEQDRISEDVVRMTLQQALRALRYPDDSQVGDASLDGEPVLPEARAGLLTSGALAESLRNRWESRADPWGDNANDEVYGDAEPVLTAELSSLFASGLGGRGGVDLSELLGGGLSERLLGLGAGLGEGGGLGALSEAGGALAALRERLGDRGEDEANLTALLEREEGLLSDRQRRALLLVGLLAAERRRDPAAP